MKLKKISNGKKLQKNISHEDWEFYNLPYSYVDYKRTFFIHEQLN